MLAHLSCYRSQTVFAIVELENFIIWTGPGRVEWGKWHWIWSYYTIYKYKFLKENILNILSTRESKRMTSLRYATYSSILPPSKGLAWILLLPFQKLIFFDRESHVFLWQYQQLYIMSPYYKIKESREQSETPVWEVCYPRNKERLSMRGYR